jgi:thiamine transporter
VSSSKRTLFLIEVAIFTALALVLDIAPFLSFKVWAQGGSISLAMIPIFIVAFRWGIKGGLLSGFLWGVLQIAVGQAWIMHWLQGAIDYLVAFTVLGFAGLFANKIKQAMKDENRKAYFSYILLGVIVGSTLRFIAHFIAGIVFFESAIDGMNVWMYSLLYNISYIVPSIVICTAAVYLLFHKQPRTLLSAA